MECEECTSGTDCLGSPLDRLVWKLRVCLKRKFESLGQWLVVFLCFKMFQVCLVFFLWEIGHVVWSGWTLSFLNLFLTFLHVLFESNSEMIQASSS